MSEVVNAIQISLECKVLRASLIGKEKGLKAFLLIKKCIKVVHAHDSGTLSIAVHLTRTPNNKA